MVLLVVGSAPCAEEDILNFSLLWKDTCNFMAVGKDAAKLPCTWLYGVTGHSEDISELRRYCPIIIHQEPRPSVDITHPLSAWEGGSSALMGVMSAMTLGYRKIVLCGVPLEGPNPGHPGADYSMFQGKWTENVSVLCNYVRSMSGFTLKLLGNPDEVWLNG